MAKARRPRVLTRDDFDEARRFAEMAVYHSNTIVRLSHLGDGDENGRIHELFASAVIRLCENFDKRWGAFSRISDIIAGLASTEPVTFGRFEEGTAHAVAYSLATYIWSIVSRPSLHEHLQVKEGSRMLDREGVVRHAERLRRNVAHNLDTQYTEDRIAVRIKNESNRAWAEYVKLQPNAKLAILVRFGPPAPNKAKPTLKQRGRPSTKARRDAIKTEFDKGVAEGRWKTVSEFMRESPQRKTDGRKYTIRAIQAMVSPAPKSKPKKRKQITRAN